MPISADKRNEVRELLNKGEDNATVAAKTGVPLRAVAAIYSHIKMGHYSEATPLQEPSAEVLDSMETTFGLERDLQAALRGNIEQLQGGLQISDGGKEKIVPSGRIDILATDKKKTRVVIELKAGTADRDAVGQIMSYIGDLQAENGGAVKGILVAGDFTARAIAASKAVPNVELRKYGFKFSFQKV
jgi:RecB family endonuclease NucS